MATLYNFNPTPSHCSTDNETKIISNSCFRNDNYKERFYNEVILKCGDWGKETLENVYNFFVNGDFKGTLSSHVNNMVVIGNISEAAIVSANTLVIVAPTVDDRTVIDILMRESQRNWQNIYVNLSKSANIINNSSRSIMLLKTFSECLKNMQNMDEEEFKKTCKIIAECTKN